MTILGILRRLFGRPIHAITEFFTSDKKAEIVTITLFGDYVDNIIYTKLGRDNVQIIPLDAKVVIPFSITDIKLLLEDWLKHRHEYIPEEFDCDDFAMCLKCFASYRYGINGIGVLIDYGMGHAYNIVPTPLLDIRIVEPQTGEVIDKTEAIKRGYLRCPCVVMI